jgi:cytochrome c oxidase subunit 4
MSGAGRGKYTAGILTSSKTPDSTGILSTLSGFTFSRCSILSDEDEIMIQKESSVHTVSYTANIIIWAALVMLTGLTILVAGADFSRFGILINILIASIKASLIVYIYMHLKYESLLFKLMLFMVVATLTTIIILTFMDILYR